MTIRELIQNGKMNRVRGIRGIKDFFDWHFCHLQDESVFTAYSECEKYEAIWTERLKTLRLIAAGRLSIESDPPTLRGWKAWMGVNLRLMCPEEYVSGYEIPDSEAMLERIAKLGSVLKRLEKIEAKQKTN